MHLGGPTHSDVVWSERYIGEGVGVEESLVASCSSYTKRWRKRGSDPPSNDNSKNNHLIHVRENKLRKPASVTSIKHVFVGRGRVYLLIKFHKQKDSVFSSLSLSPPFSCIFCSLILLRTWGGGVAWAWYRRWQPLHEKQFYINWTAPTLYKCTACKEKTLTSFTKVIPAMLFWCWTVKEY